MNEWMYKLKLKIAVWLVGDFININVVPRIITEVKRHVSNDLADLATETRVALETQSLRSEEFRKAQVEYSQKLLSLQEQIVEIQRGNTKELVAQTKAIVAMAAAVGAASISTESPATVDVTQSDKPLTTKKRRSKLQDTVGC